ncbi:MAG: CDC48 family AAA ATPase [Nanoarchaeota archaeon]|nr:CDC48 family AAA ATPase [Nanoarchaeota archaeon]
MAEEKIKEVKLKIMEALQEDAYKGIARIDSRAMRELDARPGDVIVVKGEKETVAIVDRAYPADIGENIIRVDGIIRRNAKTGIGEIVGIKKAEIQRAKKVAIAPAQSGVVVHADPSIFRRGLLGRAVMKGDLLVLGGTRRRQDIMASAFEEFSDIFGDFVGGGFPFMTTKFVVVSTLPKDAVIITDETEVQVHPKAMEISEERIPEVTYEDIGGLTEEIKKVREMVELPLKHPEIFDRLGVEAPKGVLLYGPPGTGKTLLAKAVANESEATFLLLNGPEIMSKFYGESEKKIRDLFEQAEKNAPTIIFIDEIDALAPKREEVYGEVERRVVSQLLTMLDGLKGRGKVVVIAATNRPNALDPALRRPGRLDREISINVPNKAGRLSILKIHTRNMPLEKVDLDGFASITHGFVGADLAALCKEAAMSVLRKILPQLKIKEDEPIPQDVLDKLIVTQKDFNEALKLVRPSAMREVLVEKPNVKWDDIGGLDEIKQELKEAVEWPLKHPQAFKRIGIKPPKGILIHGLPGTGKTLLAKAVANESEANFIQIKGPSLLSMWVGESEKGVRKIFERARQVAPCIIFFDEIDSIAGKRGYDSGTKVTERVLNQLLAEIDGLEELNDIVVLAATNRPDMLDSALLRPGRFDRIIFSGLPDRKARLEIFKIHTKTMPLEKVDLEKLAEKTEGYVGADIEAVCREAGMLALRENIDATQVKLKHFNAALNKIRASIKQEDIKYYKSVEENLMRAKAVAVDRPGYYG